MKLLTGLFHYYLVIFIGIHSLAFDKLEHNYYFAIFCNLPMGIPSAMTFKRYHADHHWYLGVPNYDVDITTRLEGSLVRSKFLKLLHLIFIGIIYGVKPLLVNPHVPNYWEIFNIACSLTFDAALAYFWGYKALIYIVLTSLMVSTLHFS